MLLENPSHIYSECFRCSTVRPCSDFTQDKGYCRDCRTDYRKQYAETCAGRMKNLVRTARKTAKTRGKRSREDDSHECSLTSEDMHSMFEEQDGLCAVTKLPLDFHSHLNTTVSLDRLDDAKGYVPTNCQLVCNAINASRKFDVREVLRFPLVQHYAIAREAAAVARTRC
jgi:hypothetical protein